MSNLVTKILKAYPQYPALEKLNDSKWRLNNLYAIKDTKGQRIPFRMNWAQKELLDSLHTCEIVLKCRQIGMTTFFAMFALDQVLWNDNIQAGIIAQTLDDASNIFKDKLKFSFDNLDARIRPFFKPIGDSAKELSFSNGSSIRVGTSLRSSTLQFLHISEFGKVCAKDPERAREIITGSLNTVHAGQHIFIESTAEGKEGYFYDMCQLAESKVGKELGPLDFNFRFFPWHRHSEYKLAEEVPLSDHLKDYFNRVEARGVLLSGFQKNWYAKKYETQREDMLREYPSFSDEAFAASQEGYWYISDMKKLKDAGHITNVSYDRSLLVHTAWDLGQADYQVIWFFQIAKSGDIRIIDYLQKKNCDLSLTYSILQSKGYAYGDHIWPFDAKHRDKAGINFEKQAYDIGLRGLILESSAKQDQIRLVRSTLTKCWFDKDKCKEGIVALENYKKRWSSAIGGWTSEPAHDDASHGSDAFAYLCQGIRFIDDGKSPDNDYKALKAYWG